MNAWFLEMEEYKHVQQLNNDIFLQSANTLVAAGGMAAMGIGILPSSIVGMNAANIVSNGDESGGRDAQKPKKKKKKSSPPSLSSLRASLLPPPRQQCSQCHRSYGNRRDLRRHVLAHHQGVRYMCRLCGKIMMSSKSVRAHLKSSSHRLSDGDEIALNVEKILADSGSSSVGNLTGNFTGHQSAAATSSATTSSNATSSNGKK